MSLEQDVYDAIHSGKDPNRIIANVRDILRAAGVGPEPTPAYNDRPGAPEATPPPAPPAAPEAPSADED
jgi:hypothetical protein